MFSIAAINDTDSKEQWEPLAPTKEAQEFHLSQTYHEGLVKLQAQEYDKARELLECVLKDPLISCAQVESSASDGHLLQLRFLALKNLAKVFLEQGPDHHENALRCYLQAIEIDSKDSVVWNQLGTLSCSMGLLSLSRWAFEQGLLCSPNNWNCMGKLLEVLIAIGDEVACLSVADLILRHWPSHSRALHVKRTIEDSEPVPFAPRGIDKLEPKHIRLKFLGKRKYSNEALGEEVAPKRFKESIELPLEKVSWVTLSDALLKILRPLSEPEMLSGEACRSGDISLIVRLPSSADTVMEAVEKKMVNLVSDCENAVGACNTDAAGPLKDKEAALSEEQPHERRSSRLERLRSRKPKEEFDFYCSKDPARDIFQYLESFILDKQGNKDSDQVDSYARNLPKQVSISENTDVVEFLRGTPGNCSAYHMAHLLVEYAATITILDRDVLIKLLELEKLTRNWGKDRTLECSLFLAELYYDLMSSSSNSFSRSELMSEASYHLCKIIESVALEYPFQLDEISWKEVCLSGEFLVSNGSTSTNKRSFWARYFWLSGQLSLFEGNKEKAQKEFCISLALLENNDKLDESPASLHLPHCRAFKELTFDRVLHQINLLKIDFLLEKTVDDMIVKEQYMECINLLAPLLFSTGYVAPLLSADKTDVEVKSIELSALSVLIEASQKVTPMDMEVYLNSHRRKLQVLMSLGGMEWTPRQSGSDTLPASFVSLGETSNTNLIHLIMEEVRGISQHVSQVRNVVDKSGNSAGITILRDIIADIQSLLLAIMVNVAKDSVSRRSSDAVNYDGTDQKQKCCLLNAAIAFCKIQHLDSAVAVKTQVDLIMGLHDLLAEYGLCCAGENDNGEEGTFLRFAIKHLLALDMKLKPNKDSLNGEGILSSQTFETEQLYNMDVKVEIKGNEAKESGEDKRSINGEQDGEIADEEKEELEALIDNALDQCFFCLYGLNLRGESSYEDDLAMHKNTRRGDYQTKEQCADVFQYILPYAKASSRTGMVKLRRVLRAIRKHFPQPPDDVLSGNMIEKFLDDPNLCEDKLLDEAGCDGFLESITKLIFPDGGSLKQYKASLLRSSEPYMDVYRNLFYFLAQSEEISASDKWPGFVLTKEGEEFVQQNANLFKYDLLYNPLRFESWQKLANIYDEEVDLLLNDGSKHINVTAWKKISALSQRVESSRRRSRRCLLMSLALAKTPDDQGEMHELLALVYYDSLQNVVPMYDQQTVVPSKDAAWKSFCENSLKHFKKAFSHRPDWSHAFYMGKLCEKLGYSHEIALSYYEKAIALNPSAVDPVYRMHASRLKFLYTCGKQNPEALKVLASYCYEKSIKEMALGIISQMAYETSHQPEDTGNHNSKPNFQLEGVWHMLYNDCLSALGICVEGDLKHFHKARYMLAQGLYKRGGNSDLQKAKDELSFCFKSSRSSFTINMWEIDGMVKKGRRKAPGLAGNKKALEVNLPESSRKFITCIRKYLLFYLKLLEETGDTSTLDRAHASLRSDKRFSLSIEDLVPVALGRYIRALIVSMSESQSSRGSGSDNQLEKLFSLFMDQGYLWPEICSLPEIKGPETSEASLYGYLHQHIASLERNNKLDNLEAINEKLRRRFKNPKLSNSNSAKVCKHASVAWYRSLVIGLACITPLYYILPRETQTPGLAYGGVECSRVLSVDIQTTELWNSSFEESTQLESVESRWGTVLGKIKNVIVRKVLDENSETAMTLLRSCYTFYREASSVTLPSGFNLYLVPFHYVTETQFQRGMEGVETVEVSSSRKLLLWAYTLLHGNCASISQVIKYMEENIKPKMKRGAAVSLANTTTTANASSHTASAKDGFSHGGGTEAEAAGSASAAGKGQPNLQTSSGEGQKGLSIAHPLQHCNSVVADKSIVGDRDGSGQG